MIKKLKSGNSIEVKKGFIEEQQGDALINWSNFNLNGGPDSFYRVHRKAGAQLRSATFPFQQYIRTGDAFSTMAGLLDFQLVIHAILPLPEENHLYSMLMFNIINVLEEYKKDNLCRNVFLTFPDLNKKLLLEGLFTYEMKLNNFTFVFMAETDEEYNQLTNLFGEQKKKSLWQHLSKIFKPKVRSIRHSKK